MILFILFGPFVFLLLSAVLMPAGFKKAFYINLVILLLYNVIGWIYFFKVLNYNVNGLAGAVGIMLFTTFHSLILFIITMIKRAQNV